MGKHLAVVDDRGKNWSVYKGDPAWDQCRALLKAGVAEVVLPRESLLQSTLPRPASIVIHDVPIEVVRMSADVQTIVRRQIRQKDCVQWLVLNEPVGRMASLKDPVDSLKTKAAS